LFRRNRCNREAGFTLIEVLVALAVVAVCLSAIGAVIATTVRGTRGIEDRLAMAGIAETLLAGLVDRGSLHEGSSSGEISGDRWRIDVSVLPDALIDGAASSESQWALLSIVIRVQTFRGASYQVNTTRLVPRASG
jgi:general secretion pathway protein I